MKELTPSMRQYWLIKRQVGDALLLFRMGDFYELFGDDAIEAARLLQITLTSRDKNKPDPVPMAGVPHHASTQYIQRLLNHGKKVAIAEQVGEASGEGVIHRELSRILTPALRFEEDDAERRFMASALSSDGKTFSLSLLDPSTGESRVAGGMKLPEILARISDLPIFHYLELPDAPQEIRDLFRTKPGVLVEKLETSFQPDRLLDLLKKVFHSEDIQDHRSFFPDQESELGFALLIRYVLDAQKLEKLIHLQLPLPLETPSSLRLGSGAGAHLDLFPVRGSEHSPNLFSRIERTKSSVGARTLRRWMESPLGSVEGIQERQASVKKFSKWVGLPVLGETLSQTYDLERISGRISTGLASPRDLLALGKTLALLPSLFDVPHALSEKTKSLNERTKELSENILKSFLDPAPLNTQFDLFKDGVFPELDRWSKIAKEGQIWLVEYETKERERTGISSLKLKYNRVFGYAIEIPTAHTTKAPPDYVRKQTLAGAERFITEELKKYEEDLMSASAKQKKIELELFEEFKTQAKALVPVFIEIAKILGEFDALHSLSVISQEPGWVFPQIDESKNFELEGGRHPLLDKPLEGAPFCPTDLSLSEDGRRVLLVTGPNMGGKSTYLKQAAIQVILGQMGSAIPARSARWGVFHSIHSRIGANDAIARGQSTFMVEMTELAQILRQANDRSLLILDEVGRGTSTYDGMSIAWAALEWIAAELKSRALLATHYHELTLMADRTEGIANVHVAVEEKDGKVRFLYEVRPGPASESFGIHVARMAGVPSPVLTRAENILKRLESEGKVRAQERKKMTDASQLNLL